MSFGVAQAAIRLARDGFLASDDGRFRHQYAADFTAYSTTLFLRDGKPVAASVDETAGPRGDTHPGRSERVVSAKGREAGLKAARDAFYRGDIGPHRGPRRQRWLADFDDLARYAVRLKRQWSPAGWCQLTTGLVPRPGDGAGDHHTG
jgi:gamma-glutamyltranspeptidase/glutathione hydrolase